MKLNFSLIILVSLFLNMALALNRNSVKFSLNFNFDKNSYNLTDSFKGKNLIKNVYNTQKTACLSCCSKDSTCLAASISLNECSLYKAVPVFFKDVIISKQSHIFVKGKLKIFKKIIKF